VVTQATGFRKIRRYTQETLGFGPIDLPAMTLETTGYWLVFGEALTDRLYDVGHPAAAQRLRAELAAAAATGAGARRPPLPDVRRAGRGVPAPRPPRAAVPRIRLRARQNENYRQANQLDNLVTLCPSCHRRAEAGQQTRSALAGLGYVLRNLAPLFLMCDPEDISVSAEQVSPGDARADGGGL
jgi:DEAD/DEAH box helicase domain-containing protein